MEAEKNANDFEAQKAGTGWAARRPAHDDRAPPTVRPSLALRQHGTRP
jgi:hypothetical protein